MNASAAYVAQEGLSWADKLANEIVLKQRGAVHFRHTAQFILAGVLLYVAFDPSCASTEQDVAEGFAENGHRTLATVQWIVEQLFANEAITIREYRPGDGWLRREVVSRICFLDSVAPLEAGAVLEVLLEDLEAFVAEYPEKNAAILAT